MRDEHQKCRLDDPAMLPRVAVCCSLCCGAVCCSVLQCVAVSVAVQCVAVCCSVLQSLMQAHIEMRDQDHKSRLDGPPHLKSPTQM